MASINDLATAAIASSASAPSPAAMTAATDESSVTSKTKRGAFIVLEGMDRSGKTTQAKLLEQRFVKEGRPVKVMRFPDRSTHIGQMIDGYLKSDVSMEDHVIHLLFSANRWEAAPHMHALLDSGTAIICDRFSHSGIVYSAAKRNPSLSLAWAASPERGLPRPDLVLFLDLDPDRASARPGWGTELYEHTVMQRRVRQLFCSLASRCAGPASDSGPTGISSSSCCIGSNPSFPAHGDAAQGLEGLPWSQETERWAEEDLVIIDASASVEDVAEFVWRTVKNRVARVDNGDLGTKVRLVQ